MAVGVLGLLMIVTGAVLMWALTVNIAYVDEYTLGLILFIVGILAVGLSIVMNFQRSRTTHIEERRYDRDV